MAGRAGGRERRAVQRIRSSELVATTRKRQDYEDQQQHAAPSEDKRLKSSDLASSASIVAKRGGGARGRGKKAEGGANRKQAVCMNNNKDHQEEQFSESASKHSDDDDLDLPLSKRRRTSERGQDEEIKKEIKKDEKIDVALVRKQLASMLDKLTIEEIRALTSKACRRQLEQLMELEDGSLERMKSQIDEELLKVYNQKEQAAVATSVHHGKDHSEGDRSTRKEGRGKAERGDKQSKENLEERENDKSATSSKSRSAKTKEGRKPQTVDKADKAEKKSMVDMVDPKQQALMKKKDKEESAEDAKSRHKELKDTRESEKGKKMTSSDVKSGRKPNDGKPNHHEPTQDRKPREKGGKPDDELKEEKEAKSQDRSESKIRVDKKGDIDEEDVPLSTSIDPTSQSVHASSDEGKVAKQDQEDDDAGAGANLFTRRASSGASLAVSLPPLIPPSTDSFRSNDANLFVACPIKDLEELQSREIEKSSGGAQETTAKPSTFVPSKPATLPSIPKRHKANAPSLSSGDGPGKTGDLASELDQYASARHFGDILCLWNVLSKEQVEECWKLSSGMPDRFSELVIVKHGKEVRIFIVLSDA
ncbi:hypothetical protein GUITHDRAFT_135196 [Guillardia theta CCMP2712]|uniref:Uncharacterized protein n=2 Tax=Guillardia theta TaxID=55529 RepID=L1JQ14_GUITC|nr:hypothetical protein GUITHDRAFT_135196 [Guillardia theta CCMP2712]EKX50557.1 hypothetical protein GUITHDRAFT_135196 [Guillardia theta CCMP2712]|eukprot:XP_005837537.1 hypothetical protein GUITHDRAFT_135196 [Guillardia theta CCMP2712]